MYILLLIKYRKYKMSKYVKTVAINYEKAEGKYQKGQLGKDKNNNCLLYTSPSPRDKRQSRMPSSA